MNELDWRKTIAKFSPPITAIDTGEPWLVVRPLQEGDFNRGFLQLLSQLTGVGDISESQFLSQFHRMKLGGDYFVTVIEDTREQTIIGSATLVIEHKFIHECGSVRFYNISAQNWQKFSLKLFLFFSSELDWRMLL